MNASTTKKSIKMFLCLSLLLMSVSFTSAFAWRGEGGGHGGGGYHGGHYGGGYHGYGYSGWYGPAVVVGDPYYYGAPYPVYPESYVVEVAPSNPEPMAVQQVQQNVAPQSKQVPDAALNSSPEVSKESIGDTVTVYIPNANGRFTPVNLIKSKNGYSGPQGEFYPNHPTVAQLRALYGN
jgi:hypothetical protein